jgi:hypothetical protein
LQFFLQGKKLKNQKKLLTRTGNNVYLGCKGAFSLKILKRKASNIILKLIENHIFYKE